MELSSCRSAVRALAFGLLSACFAVPDVLPGGEPPACQGPCALVASRDGRTLYVANADSRQVAWIDLGAGRVTRRVSLPHGPTGLALSPDGGRLIVTCAASRSPVVVLDAASGEQSAVLAAGHTAMSPVVSPDGRRLYVCNRFDSDIAVFDLLTGGEIARVPAVREPVAAAITPDGQLLLAANHLPNASTAGAANMDVRPVVTVLDAATLRTTAIELAHGANGLRGICVAPDGAHVLVTHLLSNFQMVPFRVDTGWINVNVVSIIDLRQRKLVATIGLDEYDSGGANPWDVVAAADGKSICVSLAGIHQLGVIDSADLLGQYARRTMQPLMGAWPIYTSLGKTLWRRIPLSGKGPRALAAVGSMVYVAEYFSDSVDVVDLQAGGGECVATIELGPTPEWSEQRVGEMLFHDATVCFQQWQSCASCHPDGRADGLNWDLMNDGVGNPKNTKSMLLAHATPPAMAEGVRMSAEEAVRSGFTHILFMRRPEAQAAAVDTYLKSLEPVPSPHLVDGRLSPQAERGRAIFHSQQIGCDNCHPAPLFTDLRSHNVKSRGASENTERFDTPTLVEVWRTAPYLHDGRYTTIRELLDAGRHGLGNGGDRLTDQEIDDLVAYVLSL